MKHVLSVVLQTMLLLIAAFCGFLLGATVPALRVSHVVSQTATNLRTYDFNWLIAVGIVYVLLLVAGVIRKRVIDSGITATAALMVTIAIIVLFTQLGVKDTPVLN